MATAFRGHLSVWARWLVVEPRRFWITFLVPGIALILCALAPGLPERNVQRAGFLIALAGVVLVVRDITDTRKRFDRPSVRTRIVQWLGRFPLRKRAPITASAHSILTVTSFGTAHVTASLGRAGDLEARIKELGKSVAQINARIAETEDRLRGELTAFREQNAREQQALRESAAALRRQLEEVSAGGIDFKYMGVAWFVIGEAAGTFSAEVVE